MRSWALILPQLLSHLTEQSLATSLVWRGNIFRRDEGCFVSCRILWTVCALAVYVTVFTCRPVAACFGLYTTVTIETGQGAKSPCPWSACFVSAVQLGETMAISLCWDGGCKIEGGMWWGSDARSVGIMLTVVCVAEVEPMQSRVRHYVNAMRESIVVKITSFWSWTTLDFNFRCDTSWRIFGKVN